MVPAGVVDSVIAELRPLLKRGDILIDGGNSHYHDDIRRAKKLRDEPGIHYVDVGTSGGVLGFEQGYCLMIGGDEDGRSHRSSRFSRRCPPAARNRVRRGARARRDGRQCAAAHGLSALRRLRRGHFVKMVHNGIEYGLMAAYAEGLNILKHADAGLHKAEADAETAPLEQSRACISTSSIIAAIAEVWRHGSIISSRLLDLTAAALARDPDLATVRRPRGRFRRRTLDGAGGDRGRRAGARAERGAVLALRVAGPGGVRRQAVVGHAARVRRPPREESLRRLHAATP